MSKIDIISLVNNGKLSSNASKQIRTVIEQNEGKRLLFTIGVYSPKRSQQQNRYLHLMFTILTKGLNDLGNEFTMIEVKAMMKYKFAKCEVVSDDGEIIGERIKGTSEMSKLELSTFIDKVISYAADTFNIQIPYPNEEMMLNFN